MQVVRSSPGFYNLALDYVKQNSLPEKAVVDAFHVAFATWHQLDYLVTRNCKHIANATIIKKIIKINKSKGMQSPFICTPEELMEA